MEDGKPFWKKKTDRWKTFSKTKMTDGKVFDRWGEKKNKTNCKRE